MSRYLQKPENALKRANEFIDVGKPARALDTLQEVFRNKKFTYTSSESIIEPIMFKYLDLCVELKKSHIAKEGLFQYRNMFQLVNVGSLENVIRGYLKMAEERTEAAQQQSSQAVLDIDDLDNLATPESILMSAVCSEDKQDRSDRTILLPWVKFLWESYCQCLELLRVNTHCETLYHDIARMAFQFCLKYNRKMEFRKLCEKLRKHLEDICKPSTQTIGVSISKPETQQLNLDTRLHQLDSAIQMELWQEAYKAIEDIHGLMNMSKKTPLAKTMANYYQKLAMVFWKAGNQLFHAAALLKLFQLTREMKKNITAEELQRMASHVLVAILAIPLPSAHPEFDRFIETDKSPLEKAQRLAVLLTLQQPPTRVSLLREMMRLNVLGLASPALQDLHRWLEVDFDPLSLCNRVQMVLDQICADENSLLKQYSQAVQDVTIVRLIRQISQVYQSIEFTRFLELAKFADAFYLERILVDCVRHNDMQIRIDHKRKCVHFGTDLSESQREDRQDGPTLQSMPSEQVRSQLVNMSIVLHRAIATINPTKRKTELEKMRVQMVESYHKNKVAEHQSILKRQKIIEDRKEIIERQTIEREEEQLRRQEELNRQQKIAEIKRMEAEQEERERKRHANEIQQIKERNLKEKMQQLSQTATGQKVMKKLDEEEIKKMDPEQIAAKEAEELIKERKEIQGKLKNQEKRVDYFERAKRLEEIPRIKKYLGEKQVQDKEFWEKQELTRIEQTIAERKMAVAQQERLKRMIEDKEEFMETLKVKRNSQFDEKVKAFAEKMAEERKVRLAQRIVQRREERRQNWLREKEEEKRRREEEVRKQKEEEERVEKEKKAKEMAAEEEKRRIQWEKQKAKELEAERKIQAEREAISKSVQEPQMSWRGGDREREPRVERPERERAERPERMERMERTERTERPERAERAERPTDSDWRSPRDRFERPEGAGRSEWRQKGGKDSSGDGDRWRRDGDGERRPDRDRPFRREGGGDRDRRDDKFPRREIPRDREDRRDDRSQWRRDDRDRGEMRRSQPAGAAGGRGPPPKDNMWRSERPRPERREEEERRPPPPQRREREDRPPRDENEWSEVKRR